MKSSLLKALLVVVTVFGLVQIAPAEDEKPDQKAKRAAHGKGAGRGGAANAQGPSARVQSARIQPTGAGKNLNARSVQSNGAQTNAARVHNAQIQNKVATQGERRQGTISQLTNVRGHHNYINRSAGGNPKVNVDVDRSVNVDVSRNINAGGNVNRGANFRGNRNVKFTAQQRASLRASHSGNWNPRGGLRFAEARQRHSRERHDRSYYRQRYNRISLFGGGYYFFDSGYWYPAYGYDSGYNNYAYDGPIYGYDELPPDQVLVNVQAALQQDGYYDGELDGDIGPQTRAALARYQRDNGLEETGAVDQPTLASLGLV